VRERVHSETVLTPERAATQAKVEAAAMAERLSFTLTTSAILELLPWVESAPRLFWSAVVEPAEVPLAMPEPAAKVEQFSLRQTMRSLRCAASSPMAVLEGRWQTALVAAVQSAEMYSAPVAVSVMVAQVVRAALSK
jgi:hypothetical protein